MASILAVREEREKWGGLDLRFAEKEVGGAQADFKLRNGPGLILG
jgi:hypothetical protein